MTAPPEPIPTLATGPEEAPLQVILAHGAGAPMDSPFMEAAATGLGNRGWRVIRFEFPYMARRREDGRKRPPDRQEILRETFRSLIRQQGAKGLVLAGKSLGARIASMEAEAAGAEGLMAFGYPFHPPGKPERTRIEHLRELTTPALFIQGERDPFGHRDEVAAYPLASPIRFHWAPDGNHDLAPRKASGRTQELNWETAWDAADTFLRALVSGG